MSEDRSAIWDELYETVLDQLPKIERRIASRLPVIPHTLQTFSAITADPNIPISRVAKLISDDGTLTSMLLKFANSATVGAPGTVKTVQHAVSLMGMRRLTNAVLSLSFEQAFKSAKSQLICMNQFRADNSERAIFARNLAIRLKCDTDTVYIASLLHDVMLPVLTEVWQDEYREQRNEETGLAEFEQATFEWDHAGMAAALMKSWNFPKELIVCVAMHHEIDKVLADPKAYPLEMVAVCTAAQLPEQLNQSLRGVQRMITIQEKFPDCNLLEIASSVDEELEESEEANGRPDLCARISKQMTDDLVTDQFRSLLVERNVGRYTLEEEIGKGGMGLVYKARHSMLRRPAAIKILDTRRLNEDAVQRFEAEVQLTCQLTSAHTITVYDYGMTPEGFFFYAMEYIDGITLTQLVNHVGQLKEEYVIRFLLQACDSLAEAHSLNLVHRDIKPENLMVQRRRIGGDCVKVLDFGLAVVTDTVESTEWGPGELCGTPLYLAPEAIETPDQIDQRMDIYALGAVGYYLLTGLNLYHECDTDLNRLLQMQVCQLPLRPSKRTACFVSSDLEDVIMSCLKKSRDQRPQDVFELADRLQACQAASVANLPAIVTDELLAEVTERGSQESEASSQELEETFVSMQPMSAFS
jgi:serine/threonine-protein kinase